MSKDNVKKMFGKMEKDAELQKKYSELMQANQIESEKALADKLVELGKTEGFEFSKEDLLAARAEFMDDNNSNCELSGSDLGNVAGGIFHRNSSHAGSRKCGAVTLSIITAGIACIVATIVQDNLLGPGGCASSLSLTSSPECK